MHISKLILFISAASALSMPDDSYLEDDNYNATYAEEMTDAKVLLARQNRGGGNFPCPSVWQSVSRELTTKFLSGRQCNAAARAAIRLNFHDCAAWNKQVGLGKGGCDGSMSLNPNEQARPENNGLQRIAADMLAMARKYSVGVADMIVFAGSHAIVTCPGGDRVRTFIGRTDSSRLPPPDLLPDVRASGIDLFRLFQAKGFSARDLAALLGAHSTSSQFFFDRARAGGSQDSTPGIWDVTYYAETFRPPAGVVVFPSDSNLANFGDVGREFRGFIGNHNKWNADFVKAMAQMSLLGVPTNQRMADCTNFLPRPVRI